MIPQSLSDKRGPLSPQYFNSFPTRDAFPARSRGSRTSCRGTTPTAGSSKNKNAG